MLVADVNEYLVSVIVPTKDSSRYLERCLESIEAQSYGNIELLVVDNSSTDDTKLIAKKFTENVYNVGPERSAQVNYGARFAKGEFIYKVDSDFVLEEDVVKSCVDKAREGFDAVVVHNTPDSGVSWIARIRKFEVDMYKHDLENSSARFVRRDVFHQIGGFNDRITAGEDYDFQNRLNEGGFRTGFVDPEAVHLGEPDSIWEHMNAYYRYGIDFVNLKKENKEVFRKKLRFFRPVYAKHWREFINHPVTALSFIAYNLLKYSSGAVGYAVGSLREYRQS